MVYFYVGAAQVYDEAHGGRNNLQLNIVIAKYKTAQAVDGRIILYHTIVVYDGHQFLNVPAFVPDEWSLTKLGC